jgi:mRNA interferase MazF
MAKISKIEVGAIVQVNLNPTVGSEAKKTRPALVLENGSNSLLDLIIICPITNAKNKDFSPFVRLIDYKAAGLTKASVVDSYQVRCISRDRVCSVMGRASETDLDQVRTNLALILNIGEEHL